jgi:hypothetical protein
VQTESPRLTFNLFAAATVSIALLAPGCATTPPHASFTQTLPKERVIDRDDNVTVTVEASPSVPIIDVEKQRLAQRIKLDVDRLKINNAASGESHDYDINVLLTRYDKGNAFARGMLAGLGQIHIDADVSEFALPEKTKVGAFHIAKTFAWGGIYGMSTSIEDVEEGFAQGVAEAVTNGKTETNGEPKQRESRSTL